MTNANNSKRQHIVPEKERFFPFREIRAGQREFFDEVWQTMEEGKNLLAHAPTGIGKTAAALAPAVHYAMKQGKTVFFLTPKQSQHKIAVETLRKIEDRSGKRVKVCDIIAKQAMCPRDIAKSHHLLFHHVCGMDTKKRSCKYIRTKNDVAAEELLQRIHHVEEAKELCEDLQVCPHATLLKAAKSAHVVICDYNYFFSELRERTMEKIELSLSDCILVVDEAHNLPDRIRSQLSDRLTSNRLKEAVSEIKGMDTQLRYHLRLVEDQLTELFRTHAKESKSDDFEINLPKSVLVRMVTRSLKQSVVEKMGFFDFVNKLKTYGTKLSTEGGRDSATLQVAQFLSGWMKSGENSSRILSLRGSAPFISFNLLDPAQISTEVFERVHASVLMSGTLYPPEMFRDILGIPEAVCKSFSSPFPKENKKVIVTKELTSKYTARSPEMFSKIADTIAGIANEVFENVAVFFPSYGFMLDVHSYFDAGPYWEHLVEQKRMKKKEKELLYQRLFKESSLKRTILWGVQAGSLSEGFDYEDNILKVVIVVGLPLSPPSLEVNNLVSYYSHKFGKRRGELYGYTYPALSKVIQAAGRGIRSETDYGMVVLMDYRFATHRYRKYFPEDMDMVLTDQPEEVCREFFKKFK